MHSPKKELLPGTQVRVASNAVIIGLADRSNPYYYVVEYPDGHREVVSIARISWYAERASAICDPDGSVTVLSSRLNAAGAIDLYHWLRTHLEELQASVGAAAPVLPADEEQ